MHPLLAMLIALQPPPPAPELDRSQEVVDQEAPAEAHPTDDAPTRREIVVVTGTQTERDPEDSPVKVDVIDRDQVERSGARDVAELLEEQPGLRVTRGIGGSGLRIMGLDPKYTVILIDGQRVTGLVNGQIDLRRLPIQNVEQVEITRGGSSVLYGTDAVAGVVNIITRRDAPESGPVEASARGSYGSFDTSEFAGRVGVGRGRWHAATHGGYRHTDGFDRRPETESTTGDAIQQWDLGVAGGAGRWGPFQIDGAVDYLQRDRQGVDASATGAVVDRRNLTETLQARLTPELSGVHGRLRLLGSYSMFRDQFVQDQRGDDALDARQETVDHLGQLRAQVDLPAGAHTFTAGGELQLEQLQGERLDPRRVDRQRIALFVQDEWVPSVSPRVSLLPGLRVDLDSYFDAWITPRIAALLRPVPIFDLRVGYGRSYRAPAFREMFLAFDNLGAGYVVRGNPSLRPEDAWGTTLDASLRPLAWIALEASAFETRLSDAIVTDALAEGGPGSPTVFVYRNVGEARTHGAELRLSLDPWRWLSVSGSYQRLVTRDLDRDRPLPGRAPHSGTAELALSHDHPRFGTEFRARAGIFGERAFFFEEEGGETRRELAPAFATVDLRVGQQLFEVFELFLGVDNVLDAGDAQTNPLVPRTYYGGVRVSYAAQPGAPRRGRAQQRGDTP